MNERSIMPRIWVPSAMLATYMLITVALTGAPITFAWKANPETTIAGYKLYRGPASGVYTNWEFVVTTNCTLDVIGREYFILRAISTLGVESRPTAEVVWDPPVLGLVLERSHDLLFWQSLSTNPVVSGSPIEFFRIRIEPKGL